MSWNLISDKHGHYITIPKRINDKGDDVQCVLFTQKLSDAKLISSAPDLKTALILVASELSKLLKYPIDNDALNIANILIQKLNSEDENV